MGEVNLREIRKTISAYIENAVLDHRVGNVLHQDDRLVPKECELWDYKELARSDSLSLGETVLDIVSFYNAYGGYIIYGVEEAKGDLEFIPVGIRPNSINACQLKQLLKNYTGDQIDVSYVELSSEFCGNEFLIGLLHVPKRSRWQAPAIFGKNGPEDKPGHCIFKRGSIYVRCQDRCVPAESKEDLQFLYGSRDNPFLITRLGEGLKDVGDLMVEHNLPDRSFICPQFFGRNDLIAELWRWLADDLDRSRVLAGDGGKGKTSIAYEFAEEVCRTGPYGVEKVVWLTAKEKQFRGALDKFVSVPRTDFFDTESMLKALCWELAVLDTEIEGATIALLKRLLNDALRTISCLVIIDDVDSVDPDEQRKILETAMQFPNSRARFLLTTRMNISYSSASCVNVGGLPREDYIDYISHLVEQLGLSPLKAKQIERMLAVTDGSPLYTESLLRLCNLGIPLEAAMNEWKGKLGSEVRKAALQREITHLSMESKRVLLACALMGEASVTEIKKVIGYDSERMIACLEELKSLFLISAKPFIKQEPRFAVSNNTARLVLENRESLVADPVAIEKAIAGVRGGRVVRKGTIITRRSVGAAIAQAVALIKDDKQKDALETIDAALKEHKDNPDLLLTRGRCLLSLFRCSNESKCLTMARRVFSKSYDYGQRKEILYQLWYESEMMAKHPQGAIDVCTFAVKNDVPTYSTWLHRRANAHAQASLALQLSFNAIGAITEMQACVADLGEAIRQSTPLEKTSLVELFFQASDDLWEMATGSSEGVVGSRELFEIMKSCIAVGDSRTVTLERLMRAAEKLHRAVLRSDSVSRAQANLLRQTVREAGETLRSHGIVQPQEEKLVQLRTRWQELNNVTSHLEQ